MRQFALGFAIALGLCGLAGIAYAAIPHSGTGVITGCSGYITGSLRLIDAEKGQQCRPWERTVEWSADSAAEPEASPRYYIVSGEGQNGTRFVQCDLDEDIATGGGVTAPLTGAVVESAPVMGGDLPSGWNGIVSPAGPLTVYVVCLDLPPLRP